MKQQAHPSKIFASLYPNAYTVGVRFGTAKTYSAVDRVTFSASNGKIYTYATDYDFQLGELAVVESPAGFAIVQIARIDETLDTSHFSNFDQLRWVVDGVQLKDYMTLQEKLNQFNELMSKAVQAEKQAELMSTMDSFESEEAQQLVKQARALFK